ncbi:alpha/beta-hydrolase [Macrophomina phaseolina]|uniref:Alpha/beta-hydrolase n=1 Tax=Macrophomina phaseolina TaxID=35725 RepID=A0ABQ8GSC7_9PEZI|nr:alpha/beta-hydrolase [Macrophomina phaseolina]
MPISHLAAASHLRLSSVTAPSSYVTAVAGVTAAALSLLLLAKSGRVSSSPSAGTSVLPSPRTTLLPLLSSDEAAALPYPPDVLPGARDVDTPYGSLRVYEWGPDDGERVLLVHGISTPCVSLAGVADGLVKSGRRVLLFDLFGRGYSDAPIDLPYDSRLYTTQILLALASSPLPWPTFSLLGYSFGGGIAADFASHFPHLVSSLILIAPSGLLRPSHISLKSKILYNTPLLPALLVNWLVGRRLYTPATPTLTPIHADESSSRASATDAAQAEAGQRLRPRSASTLSYPAPLLPGRPAVTAAAAVNWQIEHHAGFVHAFVSSIRHAPIYAQHARWRAIGERATKERVAAEAKGERARAKVLLVLGRDDPIIVAEEVRLDAEEVLGGSANVRTAVLPAGHEVPMSLVGEVVEALVGFLEEV